VKLELSKPDSPVWQTGHSDFVRVKHKTYLIYFQSLYK
jgi:hypothetical protein